LCGQPRMQSTLKQLFVYKYYDIRNRHRVTLTTPIIPLGRHGVLDIVDAVSHPE
jgi:hypothetical protein